MVSRVVLPIDSFIPEIIQSLETESCLVLQAAPGAGKTTRVPPALLQARFCETGSEILVLEPRRLAAKMAARRCADERGERVGETIGYQFRFENVTSPKTRLRFLTEGMLMRRLLGDPELRGVSAVILDEFHERHLQGDVALAFLRQLQMTRRPDLRLVVMSATLDAQAVVDYLGVEGKPCRMLSVPGRLFDVDVQYFLSGSAKVSDRPLELWVRDAVMAALNRSQGDVLVFLPGMLEIRRAADALSSAAQTQNFSILPLHGELSREEQDRAVTKASRTKVILSTNVAETSLTIDGVTTVIDSGFARVASTSWWSGLAALRTRPISRASAIQRAGRAGRTAPGLCYRLYSKGDFEGRPLFDVPEILRADLAQTVLELKTLGTSDFSVFPWFQAPPAESLESSERLLKRLGALDSQGMLTEMGRKLAELPAHPRLGRLVVEATRKGCLRQGATLAALLSEGRMEQPDLLESLQRLRVDPFLARVRDRLMEGFQKESANSVCAGASCDDQLAMCILTAFPDRVARRQTRRREDSRSAELVLSSGGAALLNDEAFAASSEYFVAVDVEEQKRLNQNRSQLMVRAACSIAPEWLLDLEPSPITETEELRWNRERVESVSRLLYDNLVLSESSGTPKDLESASEYLADRIINLGLESICDLESLRLLQERLNLLRKHCPEFASFADWGDFRQELVRFCYGKVTLAEAKDGDFPSFLIAELPSEVFRALETWTPAVLTLPRGRRVKVHYEAGKPPWIKSRLQDFFGMVQGPVVLGGRVSVTLHLLAPNQRPVQVTSDLAGFWKRVYPELRRELSRRYPRHAWPENPLDSGSEN